nr:MAG TPA: hypothetical protein [Caudoviricetes sp.]
MLAILFSKTPYFSEIISSYVIYFPFLTLYFF